MQLAIDMGNTRTKMALYEGGEAIRNWQFPSEVFSEGLSKAMQEIAPDRQLAVGWLSTAARDNLTQEAVWSHFDDPPRFFPIRSTDALPIGNAYRTPATLGTDRIVAVIAACSYFPTHPVLVIDAGTAITYDFADAQGVYQGGGISPGIWMRFKALNTFTARLPLIEPDGKPPLVGDSTAASIRSGVMLGALAEVEGIIQRYRDRYGSTLKVIVTGGDREHFENQLKNVNFASSNLVLEGIYLCIQHLTSL
jgi:type III pantothenate kinase